MSEIIFIIESSDEGGYTAKALGCSIYTEGETLDELKENIKEEFFKLLEAYMCQSPIKKNS